MKTTHPSLKAQKQERANLIAKLGWAPEVMTRDERYAATTGELWKWVAEQFGVDAADACRSRKE